MSLMYHVIVMTLQLGVLLNLSSCLPTLHTYPAHSLPQPSPPDLISTHSHLFCVPSTKQQYLGL
ncbi:hypothetical protein EXN66_Car005447 [Channa argus]|uniref:Uncharacterized protein n=1 Tax=Channa argus TaxID=215402 RepID=A0A6G1PHM4_CHAAH|nr:hypothetical protein EXN66_Car005447 [Channa argus]